jgi:hypothetical protein
MARRALVKLGLARHALATTNRPNIVSVKLTAVADEGKVEIDGPREAGDDGVRSTGPIVVGLGCEIGCVYCRILPAKIYNRLQFFYVG